jgi:hypothetical protein
MSLDWQVDGIANYESVCWIPTGEVDSEGEPRKWLNPVTEALIWATISVGIGEITAANAQEFYARLSTYERTTGAAFLRQPNDDGSVSDYHITPADILAHVGLRTNVFPKESDAKFREKLWRVGREYADRRWQNAQDRTEAEATATA